MNDPVSLLKGKHSVNGFYLGQPWPEATAADLAEFNNFKDTLKYLYDAGVLFKVDENTVGAIKPNFVIQQQMRDLIDSHRVIPASVLDSADL